MFGISLSEILLIAVVTLIAVGPQKLPGMLRSMGQWIARLRRLTTEVRAQTGIDEILREEGIDGVRELRALLRGEVMTAARSRARDPYEDTIELDDAQEFPIEGADAGGALPDDLVEHPAEDVSDSLSHESGAGELPSDSAEAPRPSTGQGGEP